MRNFLMISALLCLFGCSSELDRCIKGQFEIYGWDVDDYEEDEPLYRELKKKCHDQGIY